MNRAHSHSALAALTFSVGLACLAVAPDLNAGATLLSGLGGPAGYGVNRLYLDDDGSTCGDVFGDPGMPGTIDLSMAFPAGLTFFGMNFNNLCLNNNGNVNFSTDGTGISTYTPQAFPVADQRMIAPWWGDVDTRGGNLSDPDQNAVYWDVRFNQFTATWHNVGYYAEHNDMLDDFQMIIRTFAGCGAGAFDVEFRYHQCEWVTGDASGGSEGHGGTPAQAGFDAGDMVHFYALPGSLTEQIVNLCTTSNVNDPGVWRFRIRGGQLPCNGSGATCDTGMAGACAAGTTQCQSVPPTAANPQGSLLVCEPNTTPMPEICDGVDNDCDGSVDNPAPGMSLCPQNYICTFGECVPVCVEGGCYIGQTCTDAGACVQDACLNVNCPAGQRCDNGTCVDACLGIQCPIPSVCQSGGCVIPCANVQCDNGMVCENGVCMENCMCRDCPMNFTCSSDGTCQPSDCVGLSCAPGQVCRSGLVYGEPGDQAMCVDPCDGAVCPQGQHCQSGTCMLGAPMVVVDAGVPDAALRPEAGSGADGAADSGAGDGSLPGGDDQLVTGQRGCGCAVPGTRGQREPWAAFFTLVGLATVMARRRRARALVR